MNDLELEERLRTTLHAVLPVLAEPPAAGDSGPVSTASMRSVRPWLRMASAAALLAVIATAIAFAVRGGANDGHRQLGTNTTAAPVLTTLSGITTALKTAGIDCSLHAVGRNAASSVDGQCAVGGLTLSFAVYADQSARDAAITQAVDTDGPMMRMAGLRELQWIQGDGPWVARVGPADTTTVEPHPTTAESVLANRVAVALGGTVKLVALQKTLLANLVDVDASAASDQLTKAGLTVVTTPSGLLPAGDVRIGLVMAQKPAAGSVLESGTIVELSIGVASSSAPQGQPAVELVVPANLVAIASDAVKAQFGVSGLDASVVRVPFATAGTIAALGTTNAGTPTPALDAVMYVFIIKSETPLTWTGLKESGTVAPTGHFAVVVVDPQAGRVVTIGLGDRLTSSLMVGVPTAHLVL